MWKRYNLSRGGKITLCKSVLSNLPTYYKFTFLLPEKVASSLERSMRKFFWEGHKEGKLNHLVKWERVIKDQKDGGFGLGSLKTRNFALLSKWWWRFLNESDSLWCWVIRSIHRSNSFNWHTSGKESLSFRSLWISISRQWQRIEDLAVFKIGNGSRSTFWSDPWLDKIPLNLRFPRLFKAPFKARVQWLIIWIPTLLLGLFSFVGCWKRKNLSIFRILCTLLETKKILNELDSRIWSLEASGVFSVKSLVKHLSMASPIEYCLEKSLWANQKPTESEYHGTDHVVWNPKLRCNPLKKAPSPLPFTSYLSMVLRKPWRLATLIFWMWLCKKVLVLFVPL